MPDKPLIKDDPSIDPADLQDLVTSEHEKMASKINNAGKEDQVHFLKVQGWTEETIREEMYL